MSAAAGPSLPGVSTTLTLTPLDDRGREILDQLEAIAIEPFAGATGRVRGVTGSMLTGR